MTPQENIKWYWEDLTSNEKVCILTELYDNLSTKQQEYFLQIITG